MYNIAKNEIYLEEKPFGVISRLFAHVSLILSEVSPLF